MNVDAALRKIAEDYKKLNKEQQRKIVRTFERSIADIYELLAAYEESDGTIKRTRINKLLRELDEIERRMIDDGMAAFERVVVEETSEWTVAKVATIAGVALTAAHLTRVRARVERDVFRRLEKDGLQLFDRIWAVAGNVRDEIAKTIRESVIRGESVSSIIPKIRRVYKKETWKIERLARTEGSTAFRSATLENARQSKHVRWVLFHEGTCGRPDHHRHNCYHLAREDRYGEGPGIYKTTDTNILMPHPNCTSWISYVIEREEGVTV